MSNPARPLKFKSIAEISALPYVRINASSDGLGWRNFRLEVGEKRGCDVFDVMMDGHYVILNVAEVPLRFDELIDGAWIPGSLPPRTFWIVPEGRPISMRYEGHCQWAGATIDGTFLDSVAGRHHELVYAIGAVDPVLAPLMDSLVARLYDPAAAGDASDRDVDVDAATIRAFVLALARRHGHPAAELPIKGGITAARLRALLSWLEDNLDSSLTIATMAARVELSAAHFSREFKRSIGVAPWAYVVERRLDRARCLLDAGESIHTTAKKCGFSDRTHLSRLFRQRFGVSPLAFANRRPTCNILSAVN